MSEGEKEWERLPYFGLRSARMMSLSFGGTKRASDCSSLASSSAGARRASAAQISRRQPSRFAGFKFRRQHEIGPYFLDFYCALAKLAVELDGFGHGLPDQLQHDAERDAFLAARGIETIRFWNRDWNANREGCLLEIWAALSQRVPADELAKLEQPDACFVPPKESGIIRADRRPK
jgi:very-short-patch-repair endonuclease